MNDYDEWKLTMHVILICLFIIWAISMILVLASEKKIDNPSPNHAQRGGGQGHANNLPDFGLHQGLSFNMNNASMGENLWMIREFLRGEELNESIDSADFLDFHKKYISNELHYTLTYDDLFGGDYILTPNDFIERGHSGDCDDSAAYLALVAKRHFRLETKYYLGVSGYSAHAWIAVKTQDGWLEVDSTGPTRCYGCISKIFRRNMAVEIA